MDIEAYPTELTDSMAPGGFTCGDAAECHDDENPCGCPRPISNKCPHCRGAVTLRENVEFFVCLGCSELLYANELVPA